MTIRQVNRAGKGMAATTVARQGRTASSSSAEEFARCMDTLSSLQESDAVAMVEPTPSTDDQPSHQKERREQLFHAEALLNSLEALEQDLGHTMAAGSSAPGAISEARERLRETRDHALRQLSDSTRRSAERELLHRTAVLATVELAKSDRGDYT
jgi:hypothetical protein